jgi:hypothetical protein
MCYPVLWIRIGFNEDPDPGSVTNANPDQDPGQTLKSQKVEFSMNNTLQKGKSSTNTHMKAQKPFRKAGNQVIC